MNKVISNKEHPLLEGGRGGFSEWYILFWKSPYYTVGANFVFALNLMLPEGDRKDRPYAVRSGMSLS